MKKCAGIIIKDSKILLVRKKDTDIFISPGGKIENGETNIECLKRELVEELGVNINDAIIFSHDIAPAALEKMKDVEIISYLVTYSGDIKPQSEIVECRWFSVDELPSVKIGSIFKDHVIPKLIKDKHLL
jgi:8-oxo-dGTP pyrophosphatase MutT (NUDIX family)